MKHGGTRAKGGDVSPECRFDPGDAHDCYSYRPLERQEATYAMVGMVGIIDY